MSGFRNNARRYNESTCMTLGDSSTRGRSLTYSSNHPGNRIQ